MLYNISSMITKYFFKKKYNYVNSDQEVFIYGCQLIISSFCSISSILLLSFFINITYGILFLLFFFPIRLFCGGFHASSYIKCFLCTNTIFIMTLFCSLSLVDCNKYILVGICCYFFYYILTNAPIIHANNPLSESEARRNKLHTKKVIIIELIIINLFLIFNIQIALSIAITTTFFCFIFLKMKISNLWKRGF